jgi:P4 family phage/plasmid primase-like protien
MSTVHSPEDAAAAPEHFPSPAASAPPTTQADAPDAADTSTGVAAPPPESTPPTGPSGTITVFKALKDPEGTRKQVIWTSLFAVFQKPMVSDNKSTVPGYATCTFQDDKRKKENVLRCTALVLDVDNKTTSTTVDEAACVLPHYGFLCSTYNNRLEKAEAGYIGAPPRFRILYPYAQPVTPEQHARVWTWAEKQFADKGITVDPTTKDAGRFWFLPSCPPGTESVFEHRLVQGPLLDANMVAGPDEAAASVEGVTYDEPLQERIARAKKYLAKMPPAVQGQDGSKACFNAACTLVRGFDLPPSTSLEMLKQEYNARCTPPWSEAELQHKVDSATQSTRPRGYLLGGSFKQLLQLGDHVELAHRYLATLGEHAVFTQGATYQYEDGVWRPLPRSTQIASIMRFSGAPVAKKDGPVPLRLTENACNGVLALAEAQAADEGFFEVARRGLAFANGFLAVDGTATRLLSASPDHRARFAYPFAFHPEAEHPRWDAFLDTLWDGDDDHGEKRAVLQEFVGASLFGLAPRFKKVLLLCGDTDSGKSTLIRIVRAVFPTNTVRSVGFHEWEQDYKRAQLVDALLNTVAEVPSSDLLKSEAFKAIVAGDSVGARNPYKEAFDFVPIAGHLFAANSLPRVHDRSDAVWNRFVVVCCNRRFFKTPEPGQAKAVDGIDDAVIASETPGIIAWAVRGLEALLRTGGRYTVPPTSDEVIADWKRDSDQLLVFFDEEFVIARGKHVRTELAFERYATWAEATRHKVMSKTTFGREFEAIVAAKTGAERPRYKSHGNKAFADVVLRAPKEPQLQGPPDGERASDYANVPIMPMTQPVHPMPPKLDPDGPQTVDDLLN